MLTPDQRQHLERLTTEHANAAFDMIRASQRKHDSLEHILDAMNALLVSKTSEAYQDGLRTRPDPNSFVAGWETTARACGFEGVTEALGYLLTKEEMESLKLQAAAPPQADAYLREFIGWITVDIPALHRTSVPEVAESLERFRKARNRALAQDLPWPPTLLTTTSGLDTLTDAPDPLIGDAADRADATAFPLPDFIPPPPPAQALAPPVLHDPDAPAPQDRCLCTKCNDERARLRTLRRPPQVA